VGYNKPMNNADRLTDQFCNMALMYSLITVDRRILMAFDEDDHTTIAECAQTFQLLTDQVCDFIPTDNV
jgi:hypothetical protein